PSQWAGGTPSFSPGPPALASAATSAAVSNFSGFTTGVVPETGTPTGRVLLGTFTLTGRSGGTMTLTASDINPNASFDTSSFNTNAQFVPNINYDPLIANGTATFTVPVPEPSGLALVGLAATA